MKKLTLLFITLVLVCTCVFAQFSFTVGAGIGKKIPTYEGHEFVLGPACSIGVDFTLDNGITLFDDVELNALMFTKLNPDNSNYIDSTYYNFAEKLGVGYTFDVKKWALMFGAGIELQKLFDAEGDINEYRLGIATRFKATYGCTDRIGISLQIDPSIEFKSLGPDTVVDHAEFSGNILAGFTFKY